MRVRLYEEEIGKISKFKIFPYITIFAIARCTILVSSIRIKLYKLAKVKIGEGVYIGSGLKVSDPVKASYITIGNRVSIADNVYLINSSGPNKSKLKKVYPRKIGKINIEDDAWIGAKAIIFPGVRIGKMSIVGAGSVITKDVEDYVVVAGNPAKIIKIIKNPKEIEI